jgi:ammonia channel protein AmtB
MHSLLMIVYATCIAIICWWIVGYALAFGNVDKFIGKDGWYFAS